MQFFQERCWVVAAGCQENESCSKVLNFRERLGDRIRCTHEETVAVVKPWEDIRSNKRLGCILSEKPADQTKACKLEKSSLTDFCDVFLHGQVRVKNDSKVPGRIRQGDVVRAKSNRVREGNGGSWFQGRWKWKQKSFCFVVVKFELIFGHPRVYAICAWIEFFGDISDTFSIYAGLVYDVTSTDCWPQNGSLTVMFSQLSISTFNQGDETTSKNLLCA